MSVSPSLLEDCLEAFVLVAVVVPPILLASRQPAPEKIWSRFGHAPKDADAGLDAIAAHDPAFSRGALAARASAAFRDLRAHERDRAQAACRSFLSDGMAASIDTSAALAARQGARWIVEDERLETPQLLCAASEPLFDVVYVFLAGTRRLSLERDGLSPRRGPRAGFATVWSLTRRKSSETLPKPGLVEGFCPNCGAPVSMVDASLCAQCGSWLNSGEHDWVLTSAVDADRFQWPGLRRDPGMEFLAQVDPEVSTHFLEDRARLAFWRWQLAWSCNDASPMRGVTYEEAYGAFQTVLRAAGPASPGVVLHGLRFDSFEFGDPLDRARFMLRWTSLPGHDVWLDQEPVESAALLTLVRRKGALTAARAGLCSARCPGCGAPPRSPDEDRCGQCGTSFVDGRHHWVVESIDPA